MALYKKFEPIHFTPQTPVEKHFHDHDETWVITKGRCNAFLVDLDGQSAEFTLEAGDIWMVEAGVEHGCVPLGEGVWIFPFPGTIPVGSDKPVGHYYVEKEHYLPRLVLEQVPTDRYSGKTRYA